MKGGIVMNKIGNVKEIKEVKSIFAQLSSGGIVKTWELPYENLLTKLSAAIFFFSSDNNQDVNNVDYALGKIPGYRRKTNDVYELSKLDYRVDFIDHIISEV